MSNFSRCESFCFKFKKAKITNFFSNQNIHLYLKSTNNENTNSFHHLGHEIKHRFLLKKKKEKEKRGRNIKSRPVFVVQREDVFRFFNNAQLHFSLVH